MTIDADEDYVTNEGALSDVELDRLTAFLEDRGPPAMATMESVDGLFAALICSPAMVSCKEARASTTDPDARVMKRADGGFRPAVSVQFATTSKEQVIVGMEVVNAGSDMAQLAQLAPMVERVEHRLGRSPDEWLVDGGFPSHEQTWWRRRTSTAPSPVTPKRWPSGVGGWPASRPRRSTSSAPPPPNVSMPRPATEGGCECRCAACPRSEPSWGCSGWLTTCCARRSLRRSSSVGAEVRAQWLCERYARATNDQRRQNGSLWATTASITSIGSATLQLADTISPHGERQDDCVANRKTLRR